MHRARSGAIAAAAVIAMLATAPVGRAEDLGDKLAPIGDAIKKGAQATGAAIENGAKAVGTAIQEHVEPAAATVKQGAQDAGTTVQQHVEPAAETVKQGAQDTGAAIATGAQDTGSFFARTGRTIRDGATSLYRKAASYFSGD
jgi:hypothetical protein